MNGDQALDEIMTAHAECLRLQRELEDAAARRSDLVRAGLTAGVGRSTIAEALGVTRQRIYLMVKER